jgi:hypothetical protein
MINYGFVREVGLSMADAEAKVRTALEKEGFGVLTRIDISEKLKEKLGVAVKPYVILGACNPPNAYKALQAEENIGLMLPCNVCVRERGQDRGIGDSAEGRDGDDRQRRAVGDCRSGRRETGAGHRCCLRPAPGQFRDGRRMCPGLPSSPDPAPGMTATYPGPTDRRSCCSRSRYRRRSTHR